MFTSAVFMYLSQFEFDLIQASYLFPGHWGEIRPAQAAPQAGGTHCLQGLLEVLHTHRLLTQTLLTAMTGQHKMTNSGLWPFTLFI